MKIEKHDFLNSRNPRKLILKIYTFKQEASLPNLYMPVKISMAAVRFNHMTKFGTENYNKNKDNKTNKNNQIFNK
jgi:hypothetical protein